MTSQPKTPIVVQRSWKRRAARWIIVTLLGSFLSVAVWKLVEREWIRREGNRELAAATANADRDPDWRWDRLNATRRKPPEGKNGAALIPQIKKLSHAEWGKWQAKDEWKSRLEVPPNVRYSPRVIAELRRDVAASMEAVALARTLKDYPFGHREIVLLPDVMNTLLEDTQNTRHAVDLLRWDVVLALEYGETGRAADDLLALLNASRSIGDEPLLISQLIRMSGRTNTVRSAERALAQVSDAMDLAKFQLVLAADAEEPLLLYGARGERGAFDRLFENLETGSATPEQTIDPGFKSTWARIGWWHYRGHLPADRAFALNWMSRWVDYARLPIHEQQATMTTIPTPPRVPERLVSGLLLTAVDKVAHAHWRTTAEARCAVVGIACERFRQQHKRWPDTLLELVPAFLPAVPLDPYNAEPLRYRKLDDGVVIHSIGVVPSSAVGTKAAPPAWLPDGIEIGFRLWNPDQRRLPPPPDAEEP